jgi:hypothetical protein
MKASPFGILYWGLHILLIAAMALLTTLAPVKAEAAAQTCLPFDAVVTHLATRWDEMPIGAGMVNGGAILVLFSERSGATWTLVVRRADGSSCSIASGTGWEASDITPAGREG